MKGENYIIFGFYKNNNRLKTLCFLTCALNTRVLAHKSGRTQKDTTGVLPNSTVTAKILTFRQIYKTHVSDALMCFEGAEKTV